MVCARCAGSPTDLPTLLLALFRVLQDPEDDGHGIGRGDMDRDRRRSGGPQEGRVHRGEGARSDHENTLPLGGRVLGHIRLYGERGRGGDRHRDRHHDQRRFYDRQLFFFF